MKERYRLFLSYAFDKESRNVVDAFKEVAEKLGYEIITGQPPGPNTPPELVRSRIFSSDCFAALMTTNDKSGRTSAWISNEIGIAYALNIPLLICKEYNVKDLGLASLATSFLDFNKQNLANFKNSLDSFLRSVKFDKRLRSNDSLGSFLNGLIKRAIDGRRSPSYNKPELLDKFTKVLDKTIGKGSEDVNLLRIYSNSEIVRSVLKHLNSFEGLEPKLSIAKEKKHAMARAFVELHGDDITKYNEIFLESGSTIAEITRCLSKKLPKATGSPVSLKPHIKTNNSFAYLYLWLCASVMCDPVPEGPPDPRYGGMYGLLTQRERAPDYKSPLSDYDSGGKKIVEDMSKTIFSIKEKHKSLIFSAASGLQLSDRINAVHPIKDDSSYLRTKSFVPYKDSKVLKQLQRNCRGFHVGSYENHLFKRCLYLSGIPIIVFIHDDKLDCPVEVGKCHFMFDADMIWCDFLKDYPLSIWVACEKSTYKDVQKKMNTWLKEGEWVSYLYAESKDFPIIIAHNKRFRSFCKKASIKPFSKV